jgi:hypothetical protein
MRKKRLKDHGDVNAGSPATGENPGPRNISSSYTNNVFNLKNKLMKFVLSPSRPPEKAKSASTTAPSKQEASTGDSYSSTEFRNLDAMYEDTLYSYSKNSKKLQHSLTSYCTVHQAAEQFCQL